MFKPEEFGRLVVILQERDLGSLLHMLATGYEIQIKEITNLSQDLRLLEEHIGELVEDTGEVSLWEYKFEMMGKKLSQIGERLDFIIKNLDIGKNPRRKTQYEFHVKDLDDLITNILEETNKFYAKVQDNINKRVKTARALMKASRMQYALETLSLLDFKKEFLREFHFMEVNLLIVNQSNLSLFKQYVERAGFIYEEQKISEKECIFIIISLKSQHGQLERGIMLYNCKPLVMKDEYFSEDGTINLEPIQERKIGLELQQEQLDKQITNYRKELGVEIVALKELHVNATKFINYHSSMHFIKDYVIAEFWAMSDDWKDLKSDIQEKFHMDAIAKFQAIDRASVDESGGRKGRSGKKEEIPPTCIKTPRVLQPFKTVLNMYGTPAYREVNPLAIVAVTFPLLFGIMFGDIGQGLGLVIGGFALSRSRFMKGHPGRKSICFLIIYCGMGSIMGGFLYGEVFGIGFDEIIAFLNENLGLTLQLGIFPVFQPLEEPIDIFRLSIWIGIIQISIGLCLNGCNQALVGKKFMILVSTIPKIGLLWSGAIILQTNDINSFLTAGFWFEFPGYVPLLFIAILIFGPLLGKAFNLDYMKEERVPALVGEKSMDLFESILSFLSNIFSYARILAMVMVHLSFMVAVRLISNQISGGNIIVRTIIYTAGNILVALLELLFVTIQTIRLHFYEFFSKFFTGGGNEFVPLKHDVKYSRLYFDGKKSFIVQPER
ncbi:hypothetical protein GF325_06530 [Candidatus Bathyarchaeota archaeon]|nr:hypothetical protein [Candidatus Bathyarchaeota archaeon]